MSCRPGSFGIEDEIPWNLQWLAVNQFCKRGLEVLFREGPEVQHDPQEPVNLTAVLEAGPKSSLHGVMKPLAQPIGLWELHGGVVELHPQTLCGCLPELRHKL